VSYGRYDGELASEEGVAGGPIGRDPTLELETCRSGDSGRRSFGIAAEAVEVRTRFGELLRSNNLLSGS